METNVEWNIFLSQRVENCINISVESIISISESDNSCLLIIFKIHLFRFRSRFMNTSIHPILFAMPPSFILTQLVGMHNVYNGFVLYNLVFLPAQLWPDNSCTDHAIVRAEQACCLVIWLVKKSHLCHFDSVEDQFVRSAKDFYHFIWIQIW